MKLLLDSSVWLAWMRADDEPNHEAARAIIWWSSIGEVEVRLLDLTPYELGNVIIRAWRRSMADAEAFVTRAMTVAAAPPLIPTPAERHSAYALAEEHGLSVYDATNAAVARERRLTLVSGDRRLLKAGLAAAPAAV